MPEKVLIIDDDIDTLKLVGLMLQRQGYEISAASNGEQGIAKAGSEAPDLILLDIMMPEMDGYEVARRLKQDARTRSTPILMFTAKSQLDDKVAGFEVGADDYLTKPTNPGELQTHVRNLLAHARESSAVVTAPVNEAPHGRMIGVLAARGGLGVSTVAVNLAAAFCVRGYKKVILAEMTAGQGTLALELGMRGQKGLGDLLAAQPEQITRERVRGSLLPHNSGIQVLLASENPRDVSLQGQTRQYEALFRHLASLGEFIVLDLGAGLPPWAQKVLPLCQDCIVVAEASSNTVAHTRLLLDEICALGIDPAAISVVLNNRIRFESQMPFQEAQQGLGHPITSTLTPAPELMVTAGRRHLPAVAAVPQDVTSQQMLGLADRLLAPGRSK